MFGGRAKLFQLLAVVFVIDEVHFQKVQNGKPLQKVFSQLVLQDGFAVGIDDCIAYFTVFEDFVGQTAIKNCCFA